MSETSQRRAPPEGYGPPCVECQWVLEVVFNHGSQFLCQQVDTLGWDPVKGTVLYRACTGRRDDAGECGPEANLFEPKTEPAA